MQIPTSTSSDCKSEETAEQEQLFANTARAMGDAERFIKERHARNCYRADPNYGEGIAQALGVQLRDEE